MMNRAIALINVDICVSGDILKPYASASLKSVFLEAIKGVPSTLDSSKTYYEFLKEYHKDDGENVEDQIKILGSGSDHATFAYYAGVPALYYSFGIDKKKYPKYSGGYPLYHTGYETFYAMDKLIDPGFKLHRTCSQISLHMILQLAESSIVPLDPKGVVSEIEKGFQKMNEKALKDNGAGEALSHLKESFEVLKSSVSKWKSQMSTQKLDDLPSQRRINDVLMMLERTFLLPQGLPGRPEYRHALFSPAKFDSYAGASFPGIQDLLHDLESLSEEEKKLRFKEVRKHLSDLMIILRQAASWLSLDLEI